MIFDYETLRLIWWVLLGVLLIGFAIMGGFDLGVAILLPSLSKTETEKRILINAIAATWEGNQVWFILGAGAIFAAWPSLYALAFSGFYIAMLAILLALVLRPVGFKYRSKVNNANWRKFWDVCLFIGGVVPAFLLGVAVGKVIEGVPFYLDQHLRIFTGDSFSIPTPFSVLSGLLSVSMLIMHGAYFLNVKTEGHLQTRARRAACYTSLLTVVLFLLGGFFIYHTDGYVLTSQLAHDGPSNPLYKTVIRQSGAWFRNYQDHALLIIVPLLGIIGPILASLFSRMPRMAFVLSSVALFGIIATVGVSMFPFIIPSITNPAHSFMLWDSSSSETTLLLMLGATIIFFPVVLGYTIWVYRVLRGKVTSETLAANADIAY